MGIDTEVRGNSVKIVSNSKIQGQVIYNLSCDVIDVSVRVPKYGTI